MLRLLKRTKGITLNKTAKSIISLYLKKKNIGELKDFNIDMSNKRLTVSFTPKYFNETLNIETTGYNIVKDSKKMKSYLTFDSIKTSDNWDNSNFNKLIKDKRIEIPKKYSKLIDLVA
jgi:hypothetical protein